MDPEKLAVALRPRTGWEAVDLGLRMVRTWWRPVYLPWLTLAVPAAAIATGTLGFFGFVLFWWLLPLGEAVVVFALSRAVFGAQPTWRESLRAWRGLVRRTLPELALRRFHSVRSQRLAIGQLEGLQGAAWRSRASALSISANTGSLLAISFGIFSFGIGLALASLLTTLVPASFGVDWDLITDQLFAGSLPSIGVRAIAFFVTIPILILRPLYIGGGFGLYLDARTRLEGWDLEVGFRKLRRRIEALSHGAPRSTSRAPSAGIRRGVSTIACMLLVHALFGGGTAEAQPPEEQAAETQAIEAEAPPTPSASPPPASWSGEAARDPRTVIAEVMERPELARHEKISRWQLRETESDDTSPWAAMLGWLLISAFKPILIILLVIVLLLLIRAAVRAGQESSTRKRATAPIFPTRLAGVELRPDALPADIAAAAQSLWQRGDAAGALSLLYRGALTRLIRDGLALRESDTEDDCVRAARANLPPERTSFFADLTGAWQLVAYAHQAPDSNLGERLIREWPRHFAARASDGADASAATRATEVGA